MGFLAGLDEVQEELLYYPRCFCVGIGVGVGVSKKFDVKVFYVMGKALSGELSYPCDRSCFLGTQERVRNSDGKHAISVRAIEFLR